MSARGLLASAAAAVVCLAASTANAGPITFDTALPVHSGEVILRTQVVWLRAMDGPPPESADVNVLAIPTVLVWGIHERVTLIGGLPFLWKDAEVPASGGRRVHRGTSGFGDMRLLLRLTAVQWNEPGRTLRLAPFVGAKIPTGADDEADELGPLPPDLQLGTGSWDPTAGLILTWQTLQFELDLSASYSLRTEANDFDAGDEARGEASFQYRVVPWGNLGGGVPTFVYAVLETRASWRAADRGPRAADESGGWSWYAIPGLQLVTMRHIVEAAVELPLAQPAHDHVDFIARLSYRTSF